MSMKSETYPPPQHHNAGRQHEKQRASRRSCSGVYLASAAKKANSFCSQRRLRSWAELEAINLSQQQQLFFGVRSEARDKEEKRGTTEGQRRAEEKGEKSTSCKSTPFHFFDYGFPSPKLDNIARAHSPRQGTPDSSHSFFGTHREIPLPCPCLLLFLCVFLCAFLPGYGSS